MRFLLDTHLAVWWQSADSHMSSTVRGLVESTEDPVFVSQMSLWELATKQNAGKLRVDLPEFASRVAASGFEWLPIEIAHILEVARLPLFSDHRDPFDRLLVAQAVSESIVLLTVAAKLARYEHNVRVV